jgi:CHAD domain-containing protein
VVKRGSRLGSDPPAQALHRLRIDAKKLRYLLEFFASLYPEKTIGRLVKELKQLQDILGGFNDTEVQQSWLAKIRCEVDQHDNLRAVLVPALDRLAAAIEHRQEEYRQALGGSLGSFSSDDSRQLYRTVFGSE